MNYSTYLIERQPSDENGQRLCDVIIAELTYLANNGLDGFMLVPVQNAGHTVAVIIAARGEQPEMDKYRAAFRELTGFDDPSELLKSSDTNDDSKTANTQPRTTHSGE